MEKTEVFGELLKEEQQEIENFVPLLELADIIPPLAQKAEKKAEAYQQSTHRLEELQDNYASNPDLFEKVREVIARLNDFLTKSLEEKTSTGVKALLLKQKVEVVHRISEEKRKIKELQVRLQGIMSRVQKKDVQLHLLKGQVTVVTQQKDQLITAVTAASGNKT